MQNTIHLNQRIIVFLDSNLDTPEQLISGVFEGLKVVKLQPHQDGVSQISQVLDQYQGQVSTVHIVSHGSPGCLYLGNTQLSLDTLKHYTNYLQSWSVAEILLYGCNVATGDAGEEFLTKLHKITQANIAASRTLTGNAALGGNWELEVTLGEGEFISAFKPETLATYSSVLDSGDSSLLGLPPFAQKWLDKNNPVPNVSITETQNQITASYNGDLDITTHINEILTKLNLTNITQEISATNPTLVVKGTLENPTGYEFSVNQIPVGEITSGLGQITDNADLFKGISSTGNVDFVLSD